MSVPRFLQFAAAMVFAAASAATGADWPQWMGPARDGVWDESIPETFPAGGPRLLWEAPAGGGYAGPAVVDGRVFVTDRQEAEGDRSEGVPGTERIRCLDAATGKIIWEHVWPASYTFDYRSGPRATPTVHDGLVYVLGAEGYFACYQVADGERKWHCELKDVCKTKAPTWGFAGHPLIWNDLVIVLAGGDGATCVAFDRLTGAEKWRALSSRHSGYCPPTLIRQGDRDAVFLWHGEALNALNPADGKVLWTIPKETRFGVSMAGPVQKGNRLLVSAFWWGCRMLELPSSGEGDPGTIWETEREGDRRTTHLNSLMCTPMLIGDYIYGVCSYGQLRCLEFATGKRIWDTFAATTGDKGEVRYGHAFLTRIGRTGNRFLLSNDQGELISARLDPEGYHEFDRALLLEPDNNDAGRPVVWSHPAFSDGCVFSRNDSMIRCYRLTAATPAPAGE